MNDGNVKIWLWSTLAAYWRVKSHITNNKTSIKHGYYFFLKRLFLTFAEAESNCNEDVMQCIVKFENYLQQIDVSAEPYADIDLEQVQLDVDISADTGLI